MVPELLQDIGTCWMPSCCHRKNAVPPLELRRTRPQTTSTSLESFQGVSSSSAPCVFLRLPRPYALSVFSVQCEALAPPRRSKFPGPVVHENLAVYFIHGASATGPVPLTISMKRSARAASRSSRPERLMNSRLRTQAASPSLFNPATSSKAAARIAH